MKYLFFLNLKQHNTQSIQNCTRRVYDKIKDNKEVKNMRAEITHY